VVLPLFFILVGESCLLISKCAGDMCGMTGNDKNHARSRRFGVEDRRWSSTDWVLGGWTIGRSGDDVCGLHRAQEDKECGFFGWASKPMSTVYQWFGLNKTTGSGFLGCASKPASIIWWFGSQNHRDGFLIWASKLSRLRFVGCAIKPTGGWRRCGAHVEI
jgi:hypothetical protein